MDSHRQKKVNQLIQNELAEIFIHFSQNATQEFMVTVSSVVITADLSLAKVYVSIYPDTARQAIMKELDTLKSQIRLQLGNRLSKQLRIIPDLRFYIDLSLDQVSQIEKELNGEGFNPIL